MIASLNSTVSSDVEVSIKSSYEEEIHEGHRYDEFSPGPCSSVDWYLNNPRADIDFRLAHLRWLVDTSERIRRSFTVFIDLEFEKDGSFRFAHLRSWNPPREWLDELDTWNEESEINGMKRILESADFVFVYGRHHDFKVLGSLGVDIKELQLKTIDIQDFYMTFIHRGYNTLGSMSRFYGGTGKYVKKSSCNQEVRKQCVHDVEMLEFLTRKTLTGEILIGTPFEGELDVAGTNDPINQIRDNSLITEDIHAGSIMSESSERQWTVAIEPCTRRRD